MESVQQEGTRKIHYRKADGLPKVRRTLEGRHKSDAVVMYAMGLFETEVASLGRELRELMVTGAVNSSDAHASILVDVARKDSANRLSLQQVDYLMSIGCNAAGLRPVKNSFDEAFVAVFA